MKYEIELDDEEVKALEGEVDDIFLFVHNFLHNRARQAIDKACQQALVDGIMLTPQDKSEIAAELATAGTIITTVKQIPETIKRSIIKKAAIKTAREKSNEALAEIDAEVRKK